MSRQHRRLNGAEWDRARRAALDRDQWRCTRCGHPGGLEVHHLQSLDAGGAPFALGNLQALCRDCHIGVHLDPQRRAWRAFVAELTHDDD